MKWEPVISALILLAALATGIDASAQEPAAPTGTAPLHTRTEFSFTVDAPFEQVVPLFGANEERKWSSGWNPQFVYPTPAHDQQGMVFTVAHGQFTSVWVNTAFDLAAGHIQYAYVLNNAMAVLIDIHATPQGPQKTAVTVVYERTALMPEANEHVQHFAKGDAGAGKEWGDAMNAYVAKAGKTAKW
ncbi:MAG: hypothetical protein WCC92_00675 [Candidatus Korobacteraceae bacterium]